MKIKSWLLLTYLLMMLVPLIALYVLYISINSYYADKSFEEYLTQWSTTSNIKRLLNDDALYLKGANYDAVTAVSSDQLMITLYGANGRILYSSNPLTLSSSFEQKEQLYKDLYNFQQNFETFTYKEPVYKDGVIVGIFKITLPRTEWTEQVHSKTTLFIIGMALILLTLYVLAIYLLHVRLNKPTLQLIAQMQAFAKGHPTTPLTIKNDELGALTMSFEQMKQELIASRQLLDREQQQKEFMIASLSHDLKTPLTSIQAYTESLLSGTLQQQEQREYLQVIETKSHYMKQLLDDLMMYTLLQSPTYEMELLAVDGHEFFDMLLADYEQVSSDKGFYATTTIDVEHRYMVNPKQLMRVVDNIVANAWTYTNKGGSIHLAAFDIAPPSWCDTYITQSLLSYGVHIIVENSGTTLSTTQCAEMFEPLRQLEESRTTMKQRGAGLGLSIAKQIIDKHHGTITAVSDNNKTAIIVWLPRSVSS